MAVAPQLPVRIALFVPRLAIGGSERQLVVLAREIVRSSGEVLVVTMYPGGGFCDEVGSIPGVTVTNVGRGNLLLVGWRLATLIRRKRVSLLYAFLNTAQLYALFAKLFRPRLVLVYRIGDSKTPDEARGWKQRLINIVLRALSGHPKVCIANSDTAIKVNAFAIAPHKLRVVHNGIDTDRFRPDPLVRQTGRRALNVGEADVVIGCVGSFSVYKDHMIFVEAAQLVHAAMPNVQFITIGDDATSQGQQVRDHITRAQMGRWFRLLGQRNDVEQLLPACDVGVSSSNTEGFSNAVCEFMACGVPCVVTNVGDSAAIVADTGKCVPKSDPRALADGVLELLRLVPEERRALGERARQRIVDRFSVARMVSNTRDILHEALFD